MKNLNDASVGDSRLIKMAFIIFLVVMIRFGRIELICMKYIYLLDNSRSRGLEATRPAPRYNVATTAMALDLFIQ